MKRIQRNFVALCLLYLSLGTWVRLNLYCDDRQRATNAPAFSSFEEMADNSATYHNSRGATLVWVTGETNVLYRLLGVDNLLVEDTSGRQLRVFGNFPKWEPSDSIWLEADFKQFNSWLLPNCGLSLVSWRPVRVVDRRRRSLSNDRDGPR